MHNKHIQTIVITILFLLKGFGLHILPYKRGLDYLCLLLILLLSFGHKKLKSFYTKPILYYCAFVLLSCIYSWKMNGQGLVSVIGHSFPFFALLFYFVLNRFRLTYAQTEKVLVIVALSFCTCYIVQWLIYPYIIFAGAEGHTDIETGLYRARMPGSISCYFLLFYSINRYIQYKKIKFVVYALVGFLPIIIMGFRSLVALSAVGVFIIIPFITKSGKKTIFYSLLGAGIVMILLNTGIVQQKLAEMQHRQEIGGTFDNEEYVRYLSFDYFWNVQFTKPYEKIIGGGYPVDDTSRYYADIINAIETKHFYWNDLGIIGLSMVIGMPAVCLLVFLYLACIWKCKESSLQYIRFTLSVILLGSIFTSMELYRTGNILLLSLFLYMEYRYHEENGVMYKFPSHDRSKIS